VAKVAKKNKLAKVVGEMGERAIGRGGTQRQRDREKRKSALIRSFRVIRVQSFHFPKNSTFAA